jgi:hypothetical protein
MKYPKSIWSQGWGSDAFLHLNNNTDLFGPIDFNLKKQFIFDNFVPHAAISCNFVGHHRFCRDKFTSDKTLETLKSIDFPFNLVITEGYSSWPYMGSSTLPKQGDLNWKGPKNFVDPIFYKIIQIKNLQKIYCQNLNLHSLSGLSNKLKHLPIGHCFHNHYNKVGLIESSIENFKFNQKSNKVLIPYHNITNKSRAQEIDLLKSKTFCCHAEKSDYLPYLENLSRYRFALSLHGAGVDCHRHWEILSVGSIPLIKSSFLDPLFENLPVILYKDVAVISEDYLSREYARIKPFLNNRKKLYRKFWIDEFKK